MLTAERLRELLHYDPETGIFTRLMTTSANAQRDTRAGSVREGGYRYIRIDGPLYYEHRLVFLYLTGSFPEKHVDHINHNPSDNRLCNLRNVDRPQNMWNKKVREDSATGIKGVYFDRRRNKYCADHISNKVRVRLGRFSTAKEARDAYLAAVESIRGEFEFRASEERRDGTP